MLNFSFFNDGEVINAQIKLFFITKKILFGLNFIEEHRNKAR